MPTHKYGFGHIKDGNIKNLINKKICISAKK
jgi:hypothetical protein